MYLYTVEEWADLSEAAEKKNRDAIASLLYF